MLPLLAPLLLVRRLLAPSSSSWLFCPQLHQPILSPAQGAQRELPPPLEGVWVVAAVASLVVAQVEHVRVEGGRGWRDDPQLDPCQRRPQ